jgi:hypothetical protein
VEEEKAAKRKGIGSAVVGDTAFDNVSTTVRKPPVGYIEDTPNWA